MKVTDGRVRVAASDVANFLACRRLTQLDLARARGELRPPREFDIGFQDLVRRGEVHERAVLERFRADGLDVADVSGAEDRRPGRRRKPSGAAPGWSTRGRWPEKAPGRRCSGGRISWCGRTCCLRRTGSRGRTGFTTRSWTPSWRGPRRPAPCCRPRSTRTCSLTCRGSRRGGCTWRWATGSSPRSRWTTLPPTSGRRGGCWRPPSARPPRGTRRPRSTRSRSSTVPSAGGAICAASAGEPMTTCRWWPG